MNSCHKSKHSGKCRINLSFVVTSSESALPLSGAAYSILDACGRIVASATAGADGAIDFSGTCLRPCRTYTLSQTVAQAGFLPDSNHALSVGANCCSIAIDRADPASFHPVNRPNCVTRDPNTSLMNLTSSGLVAQAGAFEPNATVTLQYPAGSGTPITQTAGSDGSLNWLGQTLTPGSYLSIMQQAGSCATSYAVMILLS